MSRAPRFADDRSDRLSGRRPASAIVRIAAHVVCGLAAVLAASSGAARAQDARTAPPPADPRDETPAPSRVYVPFEDLKKVFGQEGQGVFVPWKEFQDLWKRAMDRGSDGSPAALAGVSSALYEGRVDGDLALVDAKLTVQSASDGETALPIGLAGATIGSATLDGKPAVLLSDKRGRRVVVRGKGTHQLDITLVAPVQPKDGDRNVTFPSAGAPVSRLDFAVPGEGVRVTVEPNLATTRSDGASGTTHVLAYVGAAPEIRLTWRPRPVETVGADAIVQSQAEVLHRVGEQTVETRVFSRFTILRSSTKSFRARYPATERLLAVEGVGIRSWNETESGAERELRVDLHNDAEGTYDLRLQFERPRAASESLADLPVITFPGASRDAGTVAVQVLPPIAVRPSAVTGLYRVPTDDLAPWMKTGFAPLAPGVTVLAWRYAGGTRSASVSVETVAPEVAVGERSVLHIGVDAAAMRAALDLDVQRAGLFQAAVSIPDGWDLESAHTVVGNDLRAVEARVEGTGDARRAILDLGTRRMGAVPVVLALRRTLALSESESQLDIPVLRVDGAVRSRGVLAVAPADAIDVRTGTVTGFVTADRQTLAAAGLPAAPGPAPVAFGFRHSGEARGASLQIVRRKPHVIAESVTTAGVEPDRLVMRHRIRWTIRYAGVDTFRFSLPKGVADRVRVTGTTLSDGVNVVAAAVQEVTKAPDAADADRVVHTMRMQAPALGELTADVEYDLPSEPLAVRATRRIDVPELRIVGAERDQGWAQVTRDPALSVEGDAKGMIYSDVREVPDWARDGHAFLAWRRLAPSHALALAVSRHEAVPILQAVVNALRLDTLIGGGAVALTEARMDVQVNGLQYLRVELPPQAQIEGAEVDGRPVSPRVENGVLLLPCPAGRGRDDHFGVRIVYREAAEGAKGRWFGADLVAPKVPDALMQATAWVVWVPTDCTHLAGSGNMLPSDSRDLVGRIFAASAGAFAPTPGNVAPTSGDALPPKITLNVGGRRGCTFLRSGEDAHLEASFVPTIFAGSLGAVAAFLVLAAGIVLSRRGVSPAATALVAASVAAIVYPWSAPGIRAACAWTIGAAAVLLVGSFLRNAWRTAADRAARQAAPPQPAAAPSDSTEVRL